MHSEDYDGEISREKDDGIVTALISAVVVGLLARLNFSPTVAPSGTINLPSLPNINVSPTTPTPLPPIPQNPPPVAVHLPSPLNPPRGITPRGGYGAPRYRISVPLVGNRSSSRAVYPGQPVDHQHGGIDFAAAKGEAVLAPEPGELQHADPGPYGQPGAVALVAAAPGGRRWAFVHVLPVGVIPRQVSTGEQIATVGENHLHLQLTIGGVLTDPTGFF